MLDPGFPIGRNANPLRYKFSPKWIKLREFGLFIQRKKIFMDTLLVGGSFSGYGHQPIPLNIHLKNMIQVKGKFLFFHLMKNFWSGMEYR